MTSTTPRRPSTTERLRAEHGPALTLGDNCDLPDDLVVEIAPGAHLMLGSRVSICRGSTIQVHRGATVSIGDDVAIGEHTCISAMAGIRIGPGATLSNMVNLHDHKHRPRTSAYVCRTPRGFQASAVRDQVNMGPYAARAASRSRGGSSPVGTTRTHPPPSARRAYWADLPPGAAQEEAPTAGSRKNTYPGPAQPPPAASRCPAQSPRQIPTCYRFNAARYMTLPSFRWAPSAA